MSKTDNRNFQSRKCGRLSSRVEMDGGLATGNADRLYVQPLSGASRTVPNWAKATAHHFSSTPSPIFTQQPVPILLRVPVSFSLFLQTIFLQHMPLPSIHLLLLLRAQVCISIADTEFGVHNQSWDSRMRNVLCTGQVIPTGTYLTLPTSVR